MTNKTINGVPRELMQTIDDLLYIMTGHDSYQRLIHKYGKNWWDPVNSVRGEICALLAAPDPIVEADGIGEPVAWQTIGINEYGLECRKAVTETKPEIEQVWILWGDRLTIKQNALYSADQVAALQSTIAQLKAESERLQAEADQNVEWEETFGPDYTGEPPAPVAVKFPDRLTYNAENLAGKNLSWTNGWNACLDEVRRMNAPLKSSK